MVREINIPEGYKQTEVGVIPNDWEVVLLDSVAKRGSGHTPDKKHPEYWNGEIKWISLKDSNLLDNLYIYDTTEKITPAGIANSSAVLHPLGAVILSRDAGVGKSAITKDVMAVSQHFMAWQCGSQLNNHFLYYWLQAEKSEFERIAIGNTIKTIGLSYFKQLKIPFPSLPEQKAIAQSLCDTDALIAQCDRLITKKCHIKQGTMQQLLTGKKRLPGFSGEWEVKKLGEVLKVRHGKSQHDVVDQNGEIPILGTGGEIGRAKTYLYDKPSVLIGRKGTIDIPQYMDIPFWTIDTLFYTEILTNAFPKFIFYRFNVIDWYSYNEASGVPSLNAKTIENIEINLPSVEEQKAIAQILSDMDAEIAALEQKRDKYKALKQGMMQELLTGKTRLVDSNRI